MSSYVLSLIKRSCRLTRFNNTLRVNGMANSTIEIGELINDNVTSSFFLPVNSGHAFIGYEMKKEDTVIELLFTEVPEQYRGMGIGGILAKEVFNYCIENKLKMILTCEYLQKFYKDNPLPEYKQFVMKSEY